MHSQIVSSSKWLTSIWRVEAGLGNPLNRARVPLFPTVLHGFWFIGSSSSSQPSSRDTVAYQCALSVGELLVYLLINSHGHVYKRTQSFIDLNSNKLPARYLFFSSDLLPQTVTRILRVSVCVTSDQHVS